MNIEQIATHIENTPVILRRLLAGVDPAFCQWRADADSWCINEIVGHLIEADHYAFKGRILPILGVKMPALPRWDEQEAAQFRHDCQKEIGELLDELETQRAKMAKFVRGIAGADLDRAGTMPPYAQLKAADFTYEWAYHDFDHIQQILEILKENIWELFSENMQFALKN